jgi:hypothetical protein
MLGNYRVAAQFAASRVVLSSTDLVGYYIYIYIYILRNSTLLLTALDK